MINNKRICFVTNPRLDEMVKELKDKIGATTMTAVISTAVYEMHERHFNSK